MVVVISTISILTLRLFLQHTKAAFAGSIIGGILNAINIIILNKVLKLNISNMQVYRKVALILTNWENHRTQTEHDNRLIIKIFMFQFINSYTSLFYVGFFKKGTVLWGDSLLTDNCNVGTARSKYATGCTDELTIQLATIMIINIKRKTIFFCTILFGAKHQIKWCRRKLFCAHFPTHCRWSSSRSAHSLDHDETFSKEESV